MKGLIHIYTGDGKGKTTAALGLGIRAYGRGLKVLMVQFLKGAETGEMKTIEKLAPGFKLYRGTEIKKFTWNMNEQELAEVKEIVKGILSYAKEIVCSENWDMLILDEVIGTVSCGFLKLEDVTSLLKNKPEGLEVVMTGRNAPEELVELADYVSEIKAVKHPYSKGIQGRKGIEY